MQKLGFQVAEKGKPTNLYKYSYTGQWGQLYILENDHKNMYSTEYSVSA